MPPEHHRGGEDREADAGEIGRREIGHGDRHAENAGLADTREADMETEPEGEVQHHADHGGGDARQGGGDRMLSRSFST